MMGVEPAEKSSRTPVGDLHRYWSQTGSSGTVESWENDVNTSDWWRTVKLPFVKEKQEASCGRLSLSGWVGRDSWKEALSTEQRNVELWTQTKLTVHLNCFGLLTSKQPRPLSVSLFPPPHVSDISYRLVPSFTSSGHKHCCHVSCSKKWVQQESSCDLLLDTTSWDIFFSFFFFWSSSKGDSTKPELQKHSSTIWFMNQFKYRTQQLVVHVDFLPDTISN